jgi:nicotinate-nucleotide adenylyltransferase
MPQPSYTIDTLVRLKEDYPENEYALIMGADNLQSFHKWKNYEQILEDYSIYVCPRPGIEINRTHQNIHIVDGVPQMEISASFIRDSIKQGKDVSYLMPEKAWKYIDEMSFYKK